MADGISSSGDKPKDTPHSSGGKGGKGGGIDDTEKKLDPVDVQQAKDLESAFQMSIFNMATNMMSQGHNMQKKIFEESNTQEQRRQRVMSMIKQGLT